MKSQMINSQENEVNCHSESQVYDNSIATQQFCCLYTKMKSQKRKIWQDGRLVLNGTSASLHDAYPPPGTGDPHLDQSEISRSQAQNLLQRIETRVETEKFLIQLEGPWKVVSSSTSLAKPAALVSKGMQKVMTRKFHKPGTYIPPNPVQRQNLNSIKRQRIPLQPGDLEKRYYGAQQTVQREFNPALSQPEHQRPLPLPGQFPSSHEDFNPQALQQKTRLERDEPLAKQWRRVQEELELPRHETNTIPPGISGFPQDNWNPPKYQDSIPPSNPYSDVASSKQQQGSHHDSLNNLSRPNSHSHVQPNKACGQPTSDTHQPSNSPSISAGKENRNLLAIVSNGFNVNNFFGEEEDSGEDDTESDQFHWNQPLPNVTGIAMKSPHTPVITTPQEEPPLPSANQIDTMTSGQESAGESLSRNQLLALFEDKKLDSQSTGNLPVTTQKCVRRFDVPIVVVLGDTDSKKYIDFVLPSASDSSSDETDNV